MEAALRSLATGSPHMLSPHPQDALGAPQLDAGAAERERAAQAASALTAIIANEGIRDQHVRKKYDAMVTPLSDDDKAGRSAAKLRMRNHTPPMSRQYIYDVRPGIYDVRPGLGPSKGSGGAANRTNAGWNKAAETAGKIGKASAVTNAAINGARIVTSDEPLETAAKAAGGLGGALAGAEVGAVLGAPGGPWGIGIGGVLGGLTGGFFGEEAVESLFDLEDSHHASDNGPPAHKGRSHRSKEKGGSTR